jgi:hypothetical protein
MTNPNYQSSTNIVAAFGQAWEGAVAAGLSRLTDDELLRMLREMDQSEIDVVGDAGDAPDWDSLTDDQLSALCAHYEARIPDYPLDEVIPHGPSRRAARPRNRSSGLSFEELESRYSPSAIALSGPSRVAAPHFTAGRWATQIIRPAYWHATNEANAMARICDLNHVQYSLDHELADAIARDRCVLARVA